LFGHRSGGQEPGQAAAAALTRATSASCVAAGIRLDVTRKPTSLAWAGMR